MCFGCSKKKKEKFDIYYYDKCNIYFNTERSIINILLIVTIKN